MVEANGEHDPTAEDAAAARRMQDIRAEIEVWETIWAREAELGITPEGDNE